MFGFLLGNKYLAIAKWIAIAAAVWYIFHTWDKAQGYDAIKLQLTGELDCVVTSHCAAKALQDAKESEAALQKAKDKIAEENKAQRAKSAQEDQEVTKHRDEIVNGLRQTIATQNKRLNDQFFHNPACEAVMKTVIPCTLE